MFTLSTLIFDKCCAAGRPRENWISVLSPDLFLLFCCWWFSVALHLTLKHFNTRSTPVATFLSLSSAAEAENGAKTLQSVWLIICLTAWLHVWKIYPDTLRVGLFSHWRAARLGNKSWLAQALWCDWHAVSGSFGQQKSISLTGKLRTLTHSQTHHSNTHPRGSVLAVLTLLPTDKRQPAFWTGHDHQLSHPTCV